MNLGGLVLTHKGHHPGVIELGCVELIDELTIAISQRVQTHPGDDIGRAIGIVARDLIHNPAFAFQTLVEAGSGRRLQQPDHGGDDAALLDEIDLLLEDREGIAIETDDKAALNLKTCPLQFLDAFDQVTPFILFLAAFDQTVFIGCLDADKNGVEPGFGHQIGQLDIVRQIDRDLSAKRHAGFAFAPLDQRRQHFGFQRLFVADKVIVDEEDVLTPTQGIQVIQLGDDLGVRSLDAAGDLIKLSRYRNRS